MNALASLGERTLCDTAPKAQKTLSREASICHDTGRDWFALTQDHRFRTIPHGRLGQRKNEAGRKFTVGETALLFKRNPALLAPIGIFIMGAGGLSLLLGVFPRLGALGLAIFLVPAAMIHFAKSDQAEALKDNIDQELVAAPNAHVHEKVSALRLSAAIGHETSALKNLSLVGPALYLAFAGARSPMLIGFGPDWRLDGFRLQL